MFSADQVRTALFPDANPTDVPSDGQFSMAAGNFVEVYGSQGTSNATFSYAIRSFVYLHASETFRVPRALAKGQAKQISVQNWLIFLLV